MTDAADRVATSLSCRVRFAIAPTMRRAVVLMVPAVVLMAILSAAGCGKQPAIAGTQSTAGQGAGAGRAVGGANGDAGDVESGDATAAQSDSSGASDGGGNGANSDVSQVFPASTQACSVYAPAQQMGKVGNHKLDELSGLAQSWRHPSILWSHNDSGEKNPRVFAISHSGQHVATWKLKGVTPNDWEDIAVGPCGKSGGLQKLSCIYVGDVGDNSNKRAQVMIHRVSEPDTLPAIGQDKEPSRERFRKSATETFKFAYPPVPSLQGKARAAAEHPDVEAIAVLPDARVILLTKQNDGHATVFRADFDKPETLIERLGVIDLRDDALKQGLSLRATGADIDRTGRYLLVRTYFRVYVFDMSNEAFAGGSSLMAPAVAAQSAIAQAPRVAVVAGLDLQGEAIAWATDGGFWHVSEGVKPPLWRVKCAVAGK